MTGCQSSKKTHVSDLQENFGKKEFVESFPAQRPEWCDSVPISESDFYFIGVSHYFSTESEARDEARSNAMNQIVKFYGTVIKNQSSETRAVKSLASDVIDPYIEREELIQSFAQRYVSQIVAENYYVEKYSLGNSREEWLCYVKCSVSKERVKKEIETFASDISERYSALLPEKQPGKYVSTGAAVEAYMSVRDSIRENPIYRSVAYFSTESGKAALDDYTENQARRIIRNCTIVGTEYESVTEKGNSFFGTARVSSSDYRQVSGIKAKVSLVSKGKVLGVAFYGVNSDNSVNIIIHTDALDYGSYTAEIQLVSDLNGFGENAILAGSSVMTFEVVPIHAKIEFVYSGNLEKNPQIERKFSETIQGAIEKNGIPILFDTKKEKESHWKFIVHLDGSDLASHESVSKSRISGNIQIQKNGAIQAKSSDFAGIGLSKQKDISFLDAAEACLKQLNNDKDFFGDVKAAMEENK